MIKEIFLPERIGPKRILAQRILAIDTHGDTIYAVVVFAKKSLTIVEALYQEELEPGDEKTYPKRLATALERLKSRIKQFDQVRISIPTTAVFKELETPFTDSEKIRMVLDYEIESMLPFALEDAIIDFIVTEQNKEIKQSKIFVAAVRTQDIQSMLDVYEQAGVVPTNITLDLFALYSLYQQIPEYKNLEHGSALVDIGESVTQISFIFEGKLRLTRSVQKGLLTIASNVSKETGVSVQEVLTKLKVIGIKATGNAEYDKAVEKYAINFFNDIQFTLNSFSLKLNYYKGVSRVLFAGKAPEIVNIEKFSNDLLQVPCEVFDPQKLFASKLIKNKLVKQPASFSNYAIALGTAIPSPEQVDFDLRRKMFVLDRSSLIKKQLIAGLAMLMAIVGYFAFTGYQQLSNLKAQAARREKREVNRVISFIPRKQRPKKLRLKPIMRKVGKILKEKEEIWAPLTQERVSFLELLLDVTKIMDKRRFDIDTNELIIAEKIPGKPTVEINGYLRSKSGSGHFTAFTEFMKRFEKSPLLQKKGDHDERLAAEKGVEFTITLEKREEV